MVVLTKGINSTNIPHFALRPSGLGKYYPQRVLRVTILLKAAIVDTAPTHQLKWKGSSGGGSPSFGGAALSARLPRAGRDVLDQAVQYDHVLQTSQAQPAWYFSEGFK